MAIGVWVTGLVTVIAKCAATAKPVYFFHPVAITSGIIWSVGNILTVPIIKTIGMALGMSVWCATQLIVGWSTGKWGLLGTPKDDSIKNQGLNYAGSYSKHHNIYTYANNIQYTQYTIHTIHTGVALVFVSLLLFFNVKPDNVDDDTKKHDKEYYQHGDEDNFHIPRTKAHVFNANLNSPESKSTHTINSQRNVLIAETSQSEMKWEREHEVEMVKSWLDKLSTTQKNIVGIVSAIIAGLCYGLMFCPVQALINDHKNNSEYSQEMIDYVFIVYNGIFLSALFYFIIYAFYMKNKPQINHRAVFPSIICGVVWAIAMDSYFVAMDKNNLGVETTFPIVSAGPQIVSSLWGVLYYKEIRGRTNILFLTGAILCSLVSVGLVSLSKFDL